MDIPKEIPENDEIKKEGEVLFSDTPSRELLLP